MISCFKLLASVFSLASECLGYRFFEFIKVAATRTPLAPTPTVAFENSAGRNAYVARIEIRLGERSQVQGKGAKLILYRHSMQENIYQPLSCLGLPINLYKLGLVKVGQATIVGAFDDQILVELDEADPDLKAKWQGPHRFASSELEAVSLLLNSRGNTAHLKFPA